MPRATGDGGGEVAVSWVTKSRSLARSVLDRLPSFLRSRLEAAHYARLLQCMNANAEPNLVVVKALVVPGSTVVDVGANIGVYTRWLTEFVGASGQVIAIEPLAETFATLKRIASRFAWTNVTLVAAAASDHPGTVWMQIPEDDRGIRNHYLARIAGDGEDAESVRSVTIDQLLGPTSVTLIKVDVEGHEFACLRGGLGTVRRSHPALLVEINRDDWDQTPGGDAVVGMLRKERYSVWTFDGKKLNQWTGAIDGVNYWFLQPSHIAALRAQYSALMPADLAPNGG